MAEKNFSLVPSQNKLHTWSGNAAPTDETSS